jgi:hypothetical protein
MPGQGQFSLDARWSAEEVSAMQQVVADGFLSLYCARRRLALREGDL